jgi:outer membrane protein assembly factor BamA
VADTYERAVEHVQELYRNEGFLHAIAGPVQIVRARCDAHSLAQGCVPVPLPPMPTQLCTYDAAGLPLSPQPLDPALTCIPDPAHGVECAPRVALVIPVKLGPRTTLWDVAFAGVKSVSEEQLAMAADLSLGEPGNAAKLDDARRRIIDWYKERGYAYADAKYALEPSPDNTRARVRFDVIEGDQVIVRDVVVRGLGQMSESVVRRRIAIEPGEPYRTSDVRRTQERVATLGVFSSVTVGLSDPYVPGPSKTVIVDVVERVPQYIEVQPGFSTGEGARGAIEYGHRDLLGYAWAATVHLQASYLPDFLILDPAVAANYKRLSSSERIATRDTVTLAWPEMGLGPTVRAQIDGVYVRDLERDFTLLKGAAATTVLWRPVREIQLSGGPEVERNDVHLFEPGQTLEGYIMSAGQQGNSDLARLLRVPDGDSLVGAVRLVFTWDRRDSAFNAHRGTYVALGIEQVNSYPVRGTAAPNLQFESHFVRLTQTLAGYLPITKNVAFAAEVRLGEIANVASCRAPYDTSGNAPPYCTYPDRLFFMGGVDSMRGWLQDAFIPQEYVDQIVKTPSLCTSSSNCAIPLRGGNLMINPRVELRFPVKAPIDGALFSDIGNLWNDPSYVFKHGLALRADVGAGVRVQTPVGPLVFDYGVNVTRKSYEDFGAFHFAIGLF